LLCGPVELGADLARAARAYLADFPVEAVEGTFEDWRPRGDDRFYGEIRSRLAERPDGMLRRHWGAVLHVVRRRG